MAFGQQVGIVKVQFIRCGVVQPAQKPRGGGHVNALGNKGQTHVYIVKQRSQRPRVDLTRLAAAGTAVQPSGMWVVGGLAAVACQQHDAGEVFC